MAVEGFSKKVIRTKGVEAPLLLYTIEKNKFYSQEVILFYGHLDRFPKEELEKAWEIVPSQQREGHIWGRGSVDNVWPPFAICLALKNC
jgi:acetylornithine deacetylase/succinyl-diaminopimelate desuccinylase-like protein